MRTYALRRLIAAFVVLVLVSLIVFSLMHLLPGDALVVPKGYTGTWQQLGTYRELALILSQN